MVLIRALEITPANVHDSQNRPQQTGHNMFTVTEDY